MSRQVALPPSKTRNSSSSRRRRKEIAATWRWTEVDGGGDESAAFSGPVRGKKRPPSPSTLPSDGEDSPSDEDDDGWAVSDEEGDAEYGKNTRHDFTVDDFPRVNSDHDEQSDALYKDPDIRVRGPSPLRRIHPFKAESGGHPCRVVYKLEDKSEINISNVQTNDCSNGCCCHCMDLLQFIDIKISGYQAKSGHSKIFGFFAARDRVEPLRNYVYRREIDNYEAVTVTPKMGMARLSLTGPARGICITSHVLFEFELCTWTEDPTEGGPKGDILIDGCAEFHNMLETKSFIENRRLYGEKCGLDVKFAVLVNAVQAFVGVEVLCAPPCGLDLNLLAKTSGFKDVIRLYQGTTQAGCIMSSVVAVTIHSCLDLRIDANPKGDGLSKKLSCYMWEDSFDSCYHGTVDRVVNLDASTTILVKVNWKSVD